MAKPAFIYAFDNLGPGPALRKMPCSRKVDKCGTVLKESPLQAMIV